jgi:hypothetical protein
MWIGPFSWLMFIFSLVMAGICVVSMYFAIRARQIKWAIFFGVFIIIWLGLGAGWIFV